MNKEDYKIAYENVMVANKMLEQEIERLAKEVEKLEKVNQMLLNSMVTEAHTKETKEIERLNNIIDKAREYIQDRYDGEVLTHTFDKDNVGELLNILKGVDKE